MKKTLPGLKAILPLIVLLGAPLLGCSGTDDNLPPLPPAPAPEHASVPVQFTVTAPASTPCDATVVIVGKDGTRRTLTLRYHVDVTPPTGRGSVQATAGDTSSLRLELDASEDTARVSALLPWGEQVALRPSPGQPNRFFARVTVPPNRAGQAHAVTFVLTDKAHNRTMVTVDLSE